jgi:curved DNA-binding protein CbpA
MSVFVVFILAAPPDPTVQDNDKDAATSDSASPTPSGNWTEWNYYQILGLKNPVEADAVSGVEGSDANDNNDVVVAAAVRKAYKAQARMHHPDKKTGGVAGGGSSQAEKDEATARFARISEAYRVLSDPKARKEYDQYLRWEKKQQQQQQRDWPSGRDGNLYAGPHDVYTNVVYYDDPSFFPDVGAYYKYFYDGYYETDPGHYDDTAFWTFFGGLDHHRDDDSRNHYPTNEFYGIYHNHDQTYAWDVAASSFNWFNNDGGTAWEEASWKHDPGGASGRSDGAWILVDDAWDDDDSHWLKPQQSWPTHSRGRRTPSSWQGNERDDRYETRRWRSHKRQQPQQRPPPGDEPDDPSLLWPDEYLEEGSYLAYPPYLLVLQYCQLHILEWEGSEGDGGGKRSGDNDEPEELFVTLWSSPPPPHPFSFSHEAMMEELLCRAELRGSQLVVFSSRTGAVYWSSRPDNDDEESISLSSTSPSSKRRYLARLDSDGTLSVYRIPEVLNHHRAAHASSSSRDNDDDDSPFQWLSSLLQNPRLIHLLWPPLSESSPTSPGRGHSRMGYFSGPVLLLVSDHSGGRGEPAALEIAIAWPWQRRCVDSTGPARCFTGGRIAVAALRTVRRWIRRILLGWSALLLELLYGD